MTGLLVVALLAAADGGTADALPDALVTPVTAAAPDAGVTAQSPSAAGSTAPAPAAAAPFAPSSTPEPPAATAGSRGPMVPSDERLSAGPTWPEALLASEYRHLSRGIQFDAGIGTQQAGYDLMMDLGVSTFRLTSHQRKWLVAWDALVGGRLGWLANTHTYDLFAGVGARGVGEVDYRLNPERDWSLYVGAGASALLQLMWHPGVALNKVNTINASDGLGGVVADGGVRLAGGVSYLSGSTSFQVGPVVQEWLRGAGVQTPFGAFTQLGVSMRLDLAGSFSARGEALYGWAPARELTGLDAKDTARRYDLSLQARYTLKNRMWLAAVLAFSQESDTVRYLGPDISYDTSRPPTFAFGLAYGYALGGEP